MQLALPPGEMLQRMISIQLFDIQNWVLNMGLAHLGGRTEPREPKVLLGVTCSQGRKLFPLPHGFELLT